MIISKEKMMQVIKEEHSVDVDEAKFRIGQTVIYTNDYGVCWGKRKIIGIHRNWLNHAPIGYYIEPKESYWCPVKEMNLEACRSAGDGGANPQN